MKLSEELLTQFAKITNDTAKPEKTSTVYGTAVEDNGTMYVRIDGSDLLTPVSTTTDMKNGERVTVTIKDHTAMVTGNISSPAARTDTVNSLSNIVNSNVEMLNSTFVASDSETYILGSNVKVDSSNIDIASNSEIGVMNSKINIINSAFTVENNRLTGLTEIGVNTIKSKFIEAGFANITKAEITQLFSSIGIIDNLVVGDDMRVTGKLVAVEIDGDLIQAGTLKANSIIIEGEDGLLYSLNAKALGEDGLADVVDEEALKKQLHGAVITDDTITAKKIHVDDIQAFNATIGGFVIDAYDPENGTTNSIHTLSKTAIDNELQGIYLGADGQIYIGGSDAGIKLYKQYDGNENYTWRLKITANDISFVGSDKTLREEVDDAAKTATNYMHYDSSNGLIINNDAEHYNTGNNVQITSNGVNIRNGRDIAAKYGKEIQMFADYSLAMSISPKEAVIKSFRETEVGKEPIIAISIGGSPNDKVDFSNLYYVEPGSHTANDIRDSALLAMIDMDNGRYADVGVLKRVGAYADDFWKSGEERYIDLWFFNGNESKAITMKVTSPGNVTPTEIKYDVRNTHAISIKAFDLNVGGMGGYTTSEYEFVRVDRNSVCDMYVDGEIGINSESDSAIVIHSFLPGGPVDDELHISKNSIHNKNGMLMFNYEDNSNVFALSKDGHVEISSSLDGTTHKYTPFISVYSDYNDGTYNETVITPTSIDCPGRISSDDANTYLGDPSYGYFRPYYKKGDKIELNILTAGFTTSNSKQVCFSVPLDRPVIGSPNITIESIHGMLLRQNGSYTHGSDVTTSTTTYAAVNNYSATLYPGFVRIVATMSVTSNTNATNNSPIGVTWSGRIKFT